VRSSAGRDRGDIGALLRMLRRRLPLILLCPILAIVAAYAIAKSERKEYKGTSVLLFKPLLLDVQLTGTPLQLPANDVTTEAGTDVGLVSLPQVRYAAARMLGHGYTPDYLKHHVKVSQHGKSQLYDVDATAPTPVAAAAVANAIAKAFISYQRQLVVGRIQRGIDTLNRKLKAGGQTSFQRKVLTTNLTKLTELKAIEPGNVELASPALPPTTPSSPKTTTDLVIGGIVGLLVGIAFALIAEQLDVKIRRPEEVEDALDLPVLATIPRSRVLGKTPGLATALSTGDAEAFRTLRTNLRYRSGGRNIRSVLVTSVTQGSGKTTVSLYLAASAAAAMPGEVLLIEADMRRPHLATLLGLDPDRGLSTALQSGQDLHDAVVTVPTADLSGGNGAQPYADGPSSRSFDVVPAGPEASDASELLSSENMSRLLKAARTTYALTIIEGPPPGLVSDVIPIVNQVDGVLLVARLGREHSPELRKLRAQLEELGVKPLGVVANFSRHKSNPYTAARR
jgi:Mrp family chromosome partitioning ATPase/capsular polysaccharide biosynthesis protein